MNKLTRGMAAAIAMIATSLAGVLPAIAATQGAIGATSTGTTVITAVIPNLVRITGLNDISLGTWSGTGDMVGSDSLCVWSTTRKYKLTATGSGASNAFTLTDGAPTPTTIPYSVQWAQSTGASSGTALTSGTQISGQVTSATSTTCASGTNSTVIVTVLDANLQASPAATYTGTLTLVVAPE